MIAVLVLPALLAPIAFVLAMWLLRLSASTGSGSELDSDSLGFVRFVGATLTAIYIAVLAFYFVFAWQTGWDEDDGNDKATAAAVGLRVIHFPGHVFNHTLLIWMVLTSALMIAFPRAIGITMRRRHTIVLGAMAATLAAMVPISIDMLDQLTAF